MLRTVATNPADDPIAIRRFTTAGSVHIYAVLREAHQGAYPSESCVQARLPGGEFPRREALRDPGIRRITKGIMGVLQGIFYRVLSRYTLSMAVYQWERKTLTPT